ncbi:XdhC family protein [Guyparkeria halophila]|uniref:XdhC family protein n=1 Tax=Guyparkeria halophila TaxID=47960 RepID=A0ABZ0YWW3_9GAMM|nr:XdhC family protein [Guyparkeria halophila]WQH16665.1 XdhC family protein [Guyparkeria halophila]
MSPSPAVASDRQAALTLAVEALEAGREVALVTVLETYGSAPRRPGSIWVIVDPAGTGPEGIPRQAGSISGGCVEDELLDWLAAHPDPARGGRPVERHFDGTTHPGLPCGGTLSVLVEWPRQAADLRPALAAVSRREAVWREVDLVTGRVGFHPIDGVVAESPCRRENALAVPFGPAWRLAIIGTGPVAEALAPLALSLGFEVDVCDPRPHADWSVPGVARHREAPERFFAATGLDARTAVVAVAHDPRLDDLALMDALESPSFHVAAMGGATTSRARRDRLAALGIDTERLRAPAGLDIGSHTPAEIAVSMAAELVAARHLERQRATARQPLVRHALDAG